VAEIDKAMVLRIVKPIWAEKTETPNRIRDRIKLVRSWAKAHGVRDGETSDLNCSSCHWPTPSEVPSSVPTLVTTHSNSGERSWLPGPSSCRSPKRPLDCRPQVAHHIGATQRCASCQFRAGGLVLGNWRGHPREAGRAGPGRRRRQLHEAYTSPDFLSQLVRETAPRAKAAKELLGAPAEKLAQAVRETVVALPWGHHVNQLAKIEQPAQRLGHAH
jgi:hypothetical protein